MNFVIDENLSRRFVNALQRQDSSVDIVRVQDVGLLGASDETILDWAVVNSRVLITQDRATIPLLVEERIRNEQQTNPILIVRPKSSLIDAVEMIVLIAKLATNKDFDYPIRWIP